MRNPQDISQYKDANTGTEFDDFSQEVADLDSGTIHNNEVKPVDLVKLVEQPEWKTILIDLVKSEKMDPWDIDIIDLTEKYIKRINELDSTDLRLPANAILAAAILLRFKARVIKISSIDDDDEDEFIKQRDREQQLIDEFLPELRAIRKDREGKITLDELVDAVEKILIKTKTKNRNNDALKAEIPHFLIPYDPINIDEKMKEVFSAINTGIDSQGLMIFSRLVEGKNMYEMIDTFIPVLYLANDGKINVWQDSWWGEIFISLNKA